MTRVCTYIRQLYTLAIYSITWVPVSSERSRWLSTARKIQCSRFLIYCVTRPPILITILIHRGLLSSLSTFNLCDYLLSGTFRSWDGPSHDVGDQSIRYEQLKREIQILATKLKGKPRLSSPPPLSKPLQEYVSLDMIYPRELCGLPPLSTHVDTANFSLVANVDLTSLARSEASSVSPRSPDSAQWAFHDTSWKTSMPQNSRHSLCASTIKASLGDPGGFEHTGVNPRDPSDMEDGTEDLDDGDYVEPVKSRVPKGTRQHKPSISGNKGESSPVIEMNYLSIKLSSTLWILPVSEIGYPQRDG